VVSSYAAIAFLLRYLRTHTLWGFIVYRLTLAAVLVGFALAQHG
jgi:undecaprenyl pyrophosphate phosphatase UppP